MAALKRTTSDDEVSEYRTKKLSLIDDMDFEAVGGMIDSVLDDPDPQYDDPEIDDLKIDGAQLHFTPHEMVSIFDPRDNVAEAVLDKVAKEYVDKYVRDVYGDTSDEEDPKINVLTPRNNSSMPGALSLRGIDIVLTFPLSDTQSRALMMGQGGNAEITHALMSRIDMKIIGGVTVDAGYDKEGPVIKLDFSDDSIKSKRKPIHRLERKLGIILSKQRDFPRIRKEIGKGLANDDDAKPIGKEIGSDHQYFNRMKEVMRSGVQCFHYHGKNKARMIFLTIPEPKPFKDQSICDRLYLKTQNPMDKEKKDLILPRGAVPSQRDLFEEKEENEESYHLSEIKQVKVKVDDNPNENDLLSSTPSGRARSGKVEVWFLMKVKRKTMEFSMVAESLLDVHCVVAYLNVLSRHFKEPHVRRLENKSSERKAKK